MALLVPCCGHASSWGRGTWPGENELYPGGKGEKTPTAGGNRRQRAELMQPLGDASRGMHLSGAKPGGGGGGSTTVPPSRAQPRGPLRARPQPSAASPLPGGRTRRGRRGGSGRPSRGRAGPGGGGPGAAGRAEPGRGGAGGG